MSRVTDRDGVAHPVRQLPRTGEAFEQLLRDHQPVHQGKTGLVCAKCRTQGQPYTQSWPCPRILGVIHHPECLEEILLAAARRENEPRLLVTGRLQDAVAASPVCPDWLRIEIALQQGR